MFEMPHEGELHDINFERCVLGCVLLASTQQVNGVWEKVTSLVVEDDFYHNDNRMIFNAMQRLANAGRPVNDIAFVAEEAGSISSLSLDHCMEAVPHSLHVVYYCDQLRDLGERRRAIRKAHEDIAKACDRNRSMDFTSWDTSKAIECFERRQVNWLWDQRIAKGCMTLISGAPGVGKSFLLCDLVARVTVGDRWPDGSPCEVGHVLLISAEDDPNYTLRPRLEDAMANLKNVRLLQQMPLGMWDMTQTDYLISDLEKHPETTMIVIDPIGSYLGDTVDAHRDNEVRRVLAPIVSICQERSIALVIIAHTRKDASGSADDAVLGSRAFTGLARTAWHVYSDPADRQVKAFLAGKNNLAAPADGLSYRIEHEPTRVVFDREPIQMTADEWRAEKFSRGGNGQSQNAGRPEKKSAAVDWLLDSLIGEPDGLPASFLLERGQAQGFGERTLRTAKKSLGVASVKRGSVNYWTIEPDSED